MKSLRFLLLLPAAFALLSGCGTTATSPQAQAPSGAQLATSFRSSGQMFGLRYAPLPRTGVLYVPSGAESVMFDDSQLHFVASSRDTYYFWSSGAYYRLQLDSNSGTCELIESGALYSRTWESSDDAAKFARWVGFLRELGCDEHRFAFVATTKFIDGSRTDLRNASVLVATITIKGDQVVWDGSLYVPKIVRMEGGALAVSLEGKSRSLWLYGSGAFQLNEYGAVETTWIGDAKVPTGVAGLEGTIDAMVALYPRIKALAR